MDFIVPSCHCHAGNRIAADAVFPHLKMQRRTGAVARATNSGNRLARLDVFAGRYGNPVTVGIKRLFAVSMVEQQTAPITTVEILLGYRSYPTGSAATMGSPTAAVISTPR